MLQTRSATSDDDPFLYELYASTRLEEIAHWGWDSNTIEGFLRMQWMAQTRSYDSQFPKLERRLVTVDGLRAGRLLLSRNDEAMQVVDISLLPGYRGQGYGEKLLADVQREAASDGLALRLSVAVGNRAKRLYEHLGFRTTGKDGMYEQMEWRGEAFEAATSIDHVKG